MKLEEIQRIPLNSRIELISEAGAPLLELQEGQLVPKSSSAFTEIRIGYFRGVHQEEKLITFDYCDKLVNGAPKDGVKQVYLEVEGKGWEVRTLR